MDRAAIEQLKREGIAPAFEKQYIRKDGTRVSALLSGTRIQEDPLLVLATIYDLTERQTLLEREREARRAAEWASARTTRLQEITAGLSAGSSPDQIARVVVHHAIEALAAAAGVLVRLDGAEVTIAHAVGYHPEMIERWRHFPFSTSIPLTDAMRTGAPVVVDHPLDFGERYPELAGESPQGSLVAVPLLVGRRPLGAIGLSFRRQRPVPPDDLDFLISITRQAAAAFERAQLFENRAYVASKLQEGLLPERLAAIPGVETAVRYQSIAGGGEVGGDFYDLFESGPERWTLALGDVAGKGTDAAVVTGLARHTVRALGMLRERPSEVLGFLNDALRREAKVPPFCTVGCAVIRRAGSGLTVEIASGGHPYPLVLRADGTVEEIRVAGTMLGVAPDPHLEEVTLGLGRGDVMMMFTDGVLDARAPGGERFGDARLREVLAATAGSDAEATASAIEAAVSAHAPGALTDDRAIVVLRVA